MGCEMDGSKTLSTEGIVDSIKSFWPADHLLFKHLPSPEGSKRLKGSSALNNSAQHHDDGNDEEDVNDSTHRVAADQSQQPQNQENDTYRPQHVRLLLRGMSLKTSLTVIC